MNRLAALLLVGVAALAMAACTASSGGGTGNGSVGGSGAGQAGPSVAPSGASSTDSADGYTKGGYSYGGGATASPAGSLEADTVVLSGFAFQPASLSVTAGTGLTFKNADGSAHTVTNGENGVAIASPAFDQQVAPGSSTEIAFATAGAIKVTCTIHHSMNLTVTVTP
jgi:plastocyanin